MPFLALHLEVLPLGKESGGAAHTSCRMSLYKALLALIAQSDEAGHVLLHPLSVKTHITVTVLQSDADQHSVRVTVCGQHALTISNALISTLAEQPMISCEHLSYQVLSVDLERTPAAAVSTWTDLLVPPSRRALRLHFVTPAIFTGAKGGPARGEVFPQPLQVFSRLLDRWREMGGPVFAHDVLGWLQRCECIVSDYRLQAEPIGLSTADGDVAVCPGWRGWITYTCREPQSACMSTLHVLARLACFTGVGDYTEVGLGVTRTEEGR